MGTKIGRKIQKGKTAFELGHGITAIMDNEVQGGLFEGPDVLFSVSGRIGGHI